MHPLWQIDFSTKTSKAVIEASAGTGKTWTIEHLFIKALLEAQHDTNNQAISIQNILVVTFTNDATNELKERIYQQLNLTIANITTLNQQQSNEKLLTTKINSSVSDENVFFTYLKARDYTNLENYTKDLRRLNHAIYNFDNAAIYTIHGFCNKILRDYPFICGVNTDFEIVNDKTQIRESLVLNFMRSEIINHQQLSKHLDVILNNLNSLFINQYTNHSLIKAITAKLPEDLFMVSINDDQQFDLQLLCATDLDAEQQKFIKAEFLLKLICYLQKHYTQILNQANVLNYDELIKKLDYAISIHPELAKYLLATFPVAFIDEFQDTDLLQWQIFKQIYRNTGHMVVVGDPKQAIYGFRGADVSTYVNARETIANTLQLTTNFRSHPNITNFVNQLFALNHQHCDTENSFFGQGIDYTQVSSSESIVIAPLPDVGILEQGTQSCSTQHKFYAAAVQLVVINGKTKSIRQQKLLNAMTFEILALLKADSSLNGKIAILVSKNSEAQQVVNHLRRYNIRATELKLGSIFATQTAQSLWLILTAVNDLTIRKNFILAITSRLFHIPSLPLSALNELFSNSSIQQNASEQKLFNQFSELQQSFYRYKEILDSSGIIAFTYALLSDLIKYDVTSTSLNRRELANIWQLVELLHNQSKQMHNHIELLLWFKNKINRAKTNDNTELETNDNNEELIRLDNDDEQIVVTTQHKAKGLEYDIVFCPYFKHNAVLDGAHDFNYRRPFFTKIGAQQELVMDKARGESIVDNHNKEAHRLNYVALTRAKSRIYVYLKQHTLNLASLRKNAPKYNSSERPDKLVELFGYVKTDPLDDNHPLFDYPQFFSQYPDKAIKDPELFPGVVVYNRDGLTNADLANLSHQIIIDDISNIESSKELSVPEAAQLHYLPNNFNLNKNINYQSYTMLTKHENAGVLMRDSTLATDAVIHEDSIADDIFIANDTTENNSQLQCKYTVLQDKRLLGAKFGILFHTLCEKYPASTEVVAALLKDYDIDVTENDYATQLSNMLNRVFTHNLYVHCENIAGVCLNNLANKIHEFEFNLEVKNQLTIAIQIKQLLREYWGEAHPFTIASGTLSEIKPGFIKGFIDVLYLHQGKFWVLDYKTNILNDYSGIINQQLGCDSLQQEKFCHNTIIQSMSEHHYYLQYLLYLVAVKRYLQYSFNIDDASHLIGGAVYFYVRGVCQVIGDEQHSGLFIDIDCASLVHKIDCLFS